MLTIDRKPGQSLLLVHNQDQCLIRVIRSTPSFVKFQFVGDRFRFLRAERARTRYPGLRIQRHDQSVVEWN